MAICCSPRRLQLFVTFLAVTGIIAVLIILFIFNWPSFAKQRVIENVIFKDGTLEMDRFKTTADLENLRISFSVFNVTNADQVSRSSAKMALQEVGPFVYHEYKTKEFIDNNQTSGLISFKLRRQFAFKPELSVGDPKKMNLTWINVPMISAISTIEDMPTLEKAFARRVLRLAIASKKEGPFMTDTVENFIFTGSYREVFKPLKWFIPKKALPDLKFAVLYNRNNTWNPDTDYIMTTSAGFGLNQTYHDLNQYVYMNGSTNLPFWGPDGNCNKLHGTDGEFFSPFLDPTKNLEVYSADLCRKLSLKSRGQISIEGISAYKFTLDDKSLQSGAKNPDNRCYCTSKVKTDCQIDGLIDLSTCVADDVVASGSHFLHGSPELFARIRGLSKPTAADEPVIYVEPNTGLAIQVHVPFQINVRLRSRSEYSIFDFFRETQPLIIPLIRVTEASEMTSEQASVLRRNLLILDSWFVSMVLGGAIVLILAIIVVAFLLCVRLGSGRQRGQFNPVPSESDPLLSHSRTPQRYRRSSAQSQ